MPWKETDPMSKRTQFIALHQSGLFTTSQLCTRFSISRKTGYKWLARYQAEGLPGLAERSRAPQTCPHRLAKGVEAALLQAREAHPSWGPKKLRAYLAGRRPELELPAASTIGELLKRHGLTEPRRARRKPAPGGGAPLSATQPNAVWCADFKGEFRTRDGQWCYPLTVTDAYSRYLLACHALPSTQQGGAVGVFARLFAVYGLPQAIRTDNGVPFATQALGGLSQLSLGWLKLGIVHQRIAPGKPQQNGRHERMHRTLKAETTRPPGADRQEQQARFDAFRTEFNEERPHEALDQQPPAAHYQPSERRCPVRVLPPAYPGHWLIRRVGTAGCFRFQSRSVFVSEVLAGEEIGLEEVEEELWSVYLYDRLLGRFHAREGRLHG